MNSRIIDQTIAATNAERCGHPTQKPVRVMQWSIDFVKGDVILDPYMGSGTTGVACVRMRRRFIGIEINKKYCDIAVKRMEAELSQPTFEFTETPQYEPVNRFLKE